MPHSFEGFLEVNEVVEQVLLMLYIFLDEDSAAEYLFHCAPACSETRLFLAHGNSKIFHGLLVNDEEEMRRNEVHAFCIVVVKQLCTHPPPTPTRAHTHTHCLSLLLHSLHLFCTSGSTSLFSKHTYKQVGTVLLIQKRAIMVVLVAHTSLLSMQNLLTQQTQATIITVALY